jgi:xanthine/CO dehydrogenase XdhC/CoxF family maturation factor
MINLSRKVPLEGDSDRMADSPKLLIVGDGPVTDALTGLVSVLGWSVTVTSTAPSIGPDVDAVVVTSHHEAVDGPTIRSALAARTAYVGAMGSRRTQTRRREWLLNGGVSQEALTALHAPIGLDIGADQPGEIAVSILAEIIGTHSGRLSAISGTVTSIGGRDGAIHPELAPGEATCPGG